MAAVGKRVIALMSSDGVVFEVEAAALMESQTIKCLIEGDNADNSSIPIPIPIVTGSILSKVIEYCRKHAEAAAKAGAGSASGVAEGADEALKAWDADFINVGQHVLYDLIMAAHYLNIKGLLDLACQTVADIIKGKTPDQIRAYFNIRNDFTPEEQEEIRLENQGIFD